MTTPEKQGSVRGWAWHSGGPCRALGDWTDIRETWSDTRTLVWIDLENPTREDLDALDKVIDLDDAALEDCLDGPERPRVDEYESYLALFLYGVLSVDAAGRFALHKIVAFCGDRFLVTVHPQAMLSVKSLHERCEKHGATMFEHGVDVLLYRLVDALVDNYLSLLDHFEDDLIKLEAESFEPRTDDYILREVARMRTELMEVRRLAAAQHSLLAPVARGEFDYVSENLRTEFRHVQEHLAHTLDCIEGLRERLSGTLNNYHSSLTKRTNDIMRLLTVFAAVLLPMSLVAGIYGMNVPVWPPGHKPQSFWVVLSFMGILGGALLWFFRTRKWL